MKIWNIIPDYMENEMENIVDDIFRGEKIQALETKRVNKYGRLIDVLFSASVIIDTAGATKSIAITERDVTEQKLADEKIRQLNVDLQANVKQLENSNKELESFSYSVSHDLRAPLRALNGYSRILEDDYLPLLDEGAKRLLRNIQENSVRMGMLIDDLLSFSKLGRKEVQKRKINIKKMVEDVLTEISKSTEHRATIKINSLITADADYALLQQVWINLISNAIKYSGKRDRPEIEIGSEDSATEITYYVRDNGSGFDMKYAGKLFGVFQRLHHSAEFEGTGVGLAIVHRIIAKHGGRIWAEAKVNEGAAFYFTIPQTADK